MREEHIFVVAAYGKSPYLEDCLRSLSTQSRPSPIIISTSTPFDGLDELASRYKAGLHVHGPNHGIGADWNQALSIADAALITIAHQDDVYGPEFSARAVHAHRVCPGAAYSFCDAGEIFSDGSQRKATRNQLVKRLLVGAAFTGKTHIHGGLRRRILFGFGNPIVCPTVTINRSNDPAFKFREDLRTNMDWLAWIDLSANSGIIRIPEALIYRRVHDSSETASCINDGARGIEDTMVFQSLWPRSIAKTIAFVYRLSYPGYLH